VQGGCQKRYSGSAELAPAIGLPQAAFRLERAAERLPSFGT
jgi:hypothetical protein